MKKVIGLMKNELGEGKKQKAQKVYRVSQKENLNLKIIKTA